MKPHFHNKRVFFQIIDALPTSRIPEFECEQIQVEGTCLDGMGKKCIEVVELWHRNLIDCIREIIGNPALQDHLQYSPVKIFTNSSCDEQVFNEMRTAEWWWDVQVSVIINKK